MADAGFRPLRKVATLLSGGTPSKANPEFWNGGVPWLTPKDMSGFHGVTEEAVSVSAIGNGTRLAPPEAIFIAVRGMSLHNEIRIVRPRTAMTFNQDIKAIVPNGIDGRFLYYVLMARRADLLTSVEAAGHGTGRLPTDRLENLLVPDFPQAEQEAIASILGALDDKIELNRRMNGTLEAMARAIFQDWFFAFGPTRAKMAGRPPTLAPDLWSLFPDRLDTEGKPEGWEASTIGQEVSVVGGTTPSTKEPAYWNGDLHWATPKDLSTLSVPVLLDTERRITPAGLAQIGSGLLPPGSVLLSSRAPIGYLAVNLVPTAINQGFIGMMCERRLPNLFVWLWTAANTDAILQKANGSTFQEISKTNFRPLPVVVPSDPVLAAFESVVRPLWERLCANVKEQETLAATRDLLLPRLMSGELRVQDAERVVEAAA